jgi:hypothetical protein
MPGIFSDDFLSLLSPLATAQYRPTPSANFPDPAAPAPGLLSIPPDPAGTASAQPAGASGSSGPNINNGINSGLANGINNHALTLMALGAGIAQGGVGRGLELASSAAQAERNLMAQQVNFRHVYNALAGAGVPADEALAAVMNPSLMRALAVKYLGPRSQGNASSAPVASPNVPAAPQGVPNGSVYSPASWKAPDGSVFDEGGRPVGGG